MRKTSPFLRVITTILTLAMFITMLPLGALRADAETKETLGQWKEIEAAETRIVYERVPFSEFSNYATTNSNEKQVYFGFHTNENTFYGISFIASTTEKIENGETKYEVSSSFSTNAVTVNKLGEDYFDFVPNGFTPVYIHRFDVYVDDVFNRTEYAISNATATEKESAGGEWASNDNVYWLSSYVYGSGGLSMEDNPWMTTGDVVSFSASNTDSNAVKFTSIIQHDYSGIIQNDLTLTTAGVDANGALTPYYVDGNKSDIIDNNLTDMYVYAPVEVQIAYAALYSQNYTYSLGSIEASTLEANIKSENQVWINTVASAEGAKYYALSDMIPGYTVSTTWDKPLDTATAGDYIMTVSVTDSANKTTELGTITVTVEDTNTPSISVSPVSVTIEAGKTETVTATVQNAEGCTVRWSTDDNAVATVENGVITGVSTGTTTVTAALYNGDTQVIDSNGQPVQATVAVTVTKAAEKVVLSATIDKRTLTIGDTATIIPAVTVGGNNVDASGATIRWSSSNEAVATVDNTGKVTAKGGGTATITAILTALKVNDVTESLNHADSVCKVDIPVAVPAINLTVDKSNVTLVLEKTPSVGAGLSYTVPEGMEATGVQYTFDVTDDNIASASLNGTALTIEGKAAGSTTVQVSVNATVNGQSVTDTAEITVRVTANAQLVQGDWEQVYEGDKTTVYDRLTADELAEVANNKGEVLLTFLNGTQVVAVYTTDGSSFAYQNVSVSGPDSDGYYRITAAEDMNWVLSTGYVFSTTIVDQWGNNNQRNIVVDNGVIKTAGWEGARWSAETGTEIDSVRMFMGVSYWVNNVEYKYFTMGMNASGELVATKSETKITTDAAYDAYLYAPVVLTGSPMKAALYAPEDGYSIDIRDYSALTLGQILSECQVLLDTTNDGTEEYSYFLSDSKHVSYQLCKADGTAVDAITAAGSYYIQVSVITEKGTFAVQDTIPVTVIGPSSASFSVSMLPDPLGTEESAKLTPSVTITMPDGTVITEGIVADVTYVEEDYQDKITLSGDVVTAGTSSGTAKVKATVNGLTVNGISIIDLITNKTVDVPVTIYLVPRVNLSTATLPAQVTLDVADAGKTSVDIPLSWLATNANNSTVTGVTYAVSVNGEAVEAETVEIDGAAYLRINAVTKGGSEVAVELTGVTSAANDVMLGNAIKHTISVNVTHNATEPYILTVTPENFLLGVGHEKELTAIVTQGTNMLENVTVAWTTSNASVARVENGVVTGVAKGTATITATVSYTLDGVQRTVVDTVRVSVAAEEELYELSLDPETLTMDVGGTGSVDAIVIYEGDPLIGAEVTWAVNEAGSGIVSVDDNGVITAMSYGTATITATYTDTEKNITKSQSVTVTVTKPSLELGQNYVVSKDTVFTLVPYVGLHDSLTPYTVQWEVTGTDGAVSVTSVTYGGLQSGSNGIQKIGNAVATVTASGTGTVTLKATLTHVNGTAISGVSDTIEIRVVEADVNLNEATMYDRKTQVNAADATAADRYEFRIKDAHTFVQDDYGLDSRIIAIQGDHRIDFSAVTLNVYKNGQLVLDENGVPIEIPASELSFYDVDTEEVGWVPIRVTYKDYYADVINTIQDTGALTPLNLTVYDEYATGGIDEEGNALDGYVWMYVCEPTKVMETGTVNINGEDVTVELTVSNIRPWMGQGVNMSMENSADDFVLNGNDRPEYNYLDVEISFTYNGTEYHYSTEANNIYNALGYDAYRVVTEGALTALNNTNQTDFSAQAGVASDGTPAMGYVSFSIAKLKVDNVDYQLSKPISIRLPVVVRENTVKKNNVVTFGRTEQWGGTQSYNFKYFLGGINISSYAISYVSDLPTSEYSIGIDGLVPEATVGSGGWYEYFVVTSPMGTSDVTAHLHSITRNDGVVLILDPADRDVELTESDYKINVDPEMLILKTEGSAIVGYETTGNVWATVTDSDGNPITEKATIKWTMHNTYYATADDITTPNAKNQSMTREIPADLQGQGRGMPVGVEAEHQGVTYFTAQLIKVGDKDVSNQYIADYAIIYVVDLSYDAPTVNVVIDYGKPVEIDMSAALAQATAGESANAYGYGYQYLGFTDLTHSTREESATKFGSIKVVADANGEGEVFYTPTTIMNGVDTVFCIIKEYTSKDDIEGTIVATKGPNSDTDEDSAAAEAVDDTTTDDYAGYHWRHIVINIIPATSVYYETDGNVSGAFALDSASSWSVEGTYSNTNQDIYKCDSETNNQIYGFDSSYTDDTKFSNGSSWYVKGQGTDVTYSRFTFTGTGFDIIARTGAQQGTLRVSVKDASGNEVKTVSVINKGELELYQIPVISVHDLPHGTYTVTIGVYEKMDYGDGVLAALNRGNEFYFDAIRIYNPIDTATASTDPDREVATDAYQQDNEFSPYIEEVRNMLIKAGDFVNVDNDVSVDLPGMVYLDPANDELMFPNGSSAATAGSDHTTGIVQTYAKIGPNNEVYLSNGQGVAFKLTMTTAAPTSFHIGAKTIGMQGTTPNVSATATLAVDIYVKENNTLSKKHSMQAVTIGTATAMFYDVMNGVQNLNADLAALFNANDGEIYVVIKNTGEGVLSITDIKLAYGEQVGAATYSVDADTVAVAADSLILDYDILGTEFESDSARMLRKTTMTVTTTTDVEYLVLTNSYGIPVWHDVTKCVKVAGENGVEVLEWTIVLRPVLLGEQSYTVTGYAEGNSGQYLSDSILVKIY